MRSGWMWLFVVLAVAAAWFLFNPGGSGDDPSVPPINDTPDLPGAKPPGPELMGSGGTRPIVPTEIRGRGMLQGVVRIAGAGVAADVELRHVTEIDPNDPYQGGMERMFIERLLDSGISSKDAIGRTSAGADGRFQFKGLAPGLYEVRAVAASGAMGFASGMLPARGARVEVNVDITDGDQTLAGRVIYANDKPFRGMVVATLGEGAFAAAMMGQGGNVRPAYTDEDGRFELTGLPKGRYQVSAIIPGALRVMGAPIQVPYEGEYELKILVGGLTVKGKVIAAATEEPIPGANVFGGGGSPEASFSIFSTRSAEDGTFELTIPAGRGGGMFVRAAGYAPQMVEFRGGVDQDVVVSMLALGSLRGRVTTQDGGTPLKGVPVFATGENRRGMGFGGGVQAAVTDADGRYVLDGVQPGAVMVHALGGGWASVGLSGFGFGDIKTPYVVEVEPGGGGTQDLEVVPSGKVTGRVLAADGRPVPGAVVQAGGPRDVRGIVTMLMGMGISFASDVTDADGAYTIDAIVPGTEYSLVAKAPDHPDAQSKAFTGAAGKTETIDIRFPASRWLDVRVIESGGAPIAGARVRVIPKSEGGMRGMEGLFGPGSLFTTDSQGQVRVGPLPEGELQVGVAAGGYIDHRADVPTTEGSPLTIELQKGLVIAGRIVLPEGIPAQSIRVRIRRERRGEGEEWFFGRAPVDAEGRFRLDTLKASGEYKVTGRGEWENRRFEGSVVADAGDENVVLELAEREGEQRETVEVLVFDADGKPVPAGRVQLWSFRDQGNSTSTSRTRLNNGKALFRGFETDGELYVEVFDLVGSSRGATIQGPVTVSGGKLEVRLPRPVSIAGTVTASDGRGVVGVRIEARPVHPRPGTSRNGQEHGEVVTDGDGRFEFKGLGPLAYKLRVQPPADYAPVAEREAQGGDRKVAITLQTGVKATLTLRDESGAPVVGATAWVRGHRGEPGPGLDPDRFDDIPSIRSRTSMRSDTDGVLRLTGLLPGVVFDVTVNPPDGREDELRPIQLEKWTPADETLTFSRAYTIQGQVRTTEGKVPTSVNVRYRKVGSQAWRWGGNVDEDGDFVLKQLESGRYELKVGGGIESIAVPRSPGAAAPPERNVVTARAGATGVKLVVDLGATLTVRIEDVPSSGDSRPMNAYLREEGERAGQYVHGTWSRRDTVSFRGLKTDATYTLWIGGLPDSRYVRKTGVRAQRTPLAVRSEQGGSISGTVKWPPEAGTLRHVGVSAYHPDGRGGSATVDLKTGRFEISGLPPGDYTVAAHGNAEDRGQWVGQAETALGGTVEITLKRRETGPRR